MSRDLLTEVLSCIPFMLVNLSIILPFWAVVISIVKPVFDLYLIDFGLLLTT